MRFFLKKNAAQVTIGYLIFLLSGSPAFANKAVLKNIAVTNTESHLSLYFNVAECFTEEMKKAIENGIGVTFNFFIKVYEIREFWWDRKIADIKVNHHVQYDSLKKIYMVTRSERGDKPIMVRDFNAVEPLMSEIRELNVADLQTLRTDFSYQIRMMAELDRIRLPLNLHYVFFFLSLWDFETDWYSVDFTY